MVDSLFDATMLGEMDAPVVRLLMVKFARLRKVLPLQRVVSLGRRARRVFKKRRAKT
jgi:hypothetical protein